MEQYGNGPLQRKIAFITGASRGIGKGIALEFAKAGYDLILNCHKNRELLDDLIKTLKNTYHIQCYAMIGDISNPDIVNKMCSEAFAEFGDPDVLINNAGIAYYGLLNEMSTENWQQVLNANLSSAFYCSKEVIPSMIKKKRGKIINISSIWGNCGASYEVAYSVSKGGLNTYTKALAKELAPSNIQVNAISCGVIDTQMNEHLSPEERQALMDEIPACRFGTTKEVGELALLLAMAPDYLTGQIITMDGGLL